jgi:hypothetical protein
MAYAIPAAGVTSTVATTDFEIGEQVMRVNPVNVLHPHEAGIVIKRFVKAGKVRRCLVQWNDSGRTMPIRAASLKPVGREDGGRRPFPRKTP